MPPNLITVLLFVICWPNSIKTRLPVTQKIISLPISTKNTCYFRSSIQQYITVFLRSMVSCCTWYYTKCILKQRKHNYITTNRAKINVIPLITAIPYYLRFSYWKKCLYNKENYLYFIGPIVRTVRKINKTFLDRVHRDFVYWCFDLSNLRLCSE